jgi:hypothetical protein
MLADLDAVEVVEIGGGVVQRERVQRRGREVLALHVRSALRLLDQHGQRAARHHR